MGRKKTRFEHPQTQLVPIGERFRKIRMYRGLSLEEASAHVGTVRQTLALVETGHRAPLWEETRGLAQLYGTSMAWLLEGTGQMVE